MVGGASVLLLYVKLTGGKGKTAPKEILGRYGLKRYNSDSGIYSIYSDIHRQIIGQKVDILIIDIHVSLVQ